MDERTANALSLLPVISPSNVLISLVAARPIAILIGLPLRSFATRHPGPADSLELAGGASLVQTIPGHRLGWRGSVLFPLLIGMLGAQPTRPSAFGPGRQLGFLPSVMR